MRVVYIHLIAILMLGAVIFQDAAAQNSTCIKEEGSEYELLTNSTSCIYDVDEDGCTFAKQCMNGYYYSGPVNVTCRYLVGENRTEWADDSTLKPVPPCEPCVAPNYGDNCSESMYCSSACQYNTVDGCNKSGDLDECNLGNMALTVNSSIVQGTIGLHEFVEMIVYVNLPANDVKVGVTFEGDDQVLTGSAYAGGRTTYKHQVKVSLNNGSTGGIYTFQASVRDQSVTVVKEENITLNICDPVRVDHYEWDPSEIVEVDRGAQNLTYTCTATGEPQPDIVWKYGGVEVSLVEVESRIYQVKNDSSSTLYIRPVTGIEMRDSGAFICHAMNRDGEGNAFVDLVQLNILVRDPGYEEVIYAEQSDFLIGIIIVGVALFITILVFIIFVMWLKRNHHPKKYEKKKQASRQNQYIHHSPTRTEPTPLPTTPVHISPPIQPQPQVRPRASTQVDPPPTSPPRPLPEITKHPTLPAMTHPAPGPKRTHWSTGDTMQPAMRQPPPSRHNTKLPLPTIAQPPNFSNYQHSRPTPSTGPYPNHRVSNSTSPPYANAEQQHRQSKQQQQQRQRQLQQQQQQQQQIYKNDAFDANPEQMYNFYDDTAGSYEDTGPTAGRSGSLNSTHSDYLKMSGLGDDAIYTEPADDEPEVYESPMEAGY